ncbi:MAG: O-antigen ligase family protein [Pirellulales bacterium]
MARPVKTNGESRETTGRWPAFLLGGYMALLVARTMVPEDPGGKLGLGAPFDALWILLAIGWLLGQFRLGRMRLRFGLADALVVALVLWYSVAALLAMPSGSPRPAMNMLWEWVVMGMAYFLGRQLLTDESQRKSVVTVMIGLAAGLAAVSIYQNFVTIPADVVAYDAAKDSVESLYQATGQWLEPGSHERISFEARLSSRLPTATFALSNSLAGFLVPWLVMLCGIIGSLRPRSRVLAALAIVMLVCYSIWLTGSRTAGVAAIVGLLLVVAARARNAAFSSRVWCMAMGAALVGLVAAVGMGLATSVGQRAMSAAWRSLAFRVDYWRASLGIIRDYPITGCGPGQFQDTYTAYKLLTAPEEIQDPHNWFIELWSTAGAPAALLMLAVIGVIAFHAWRATWRRNDEVGMSSPTNRSIEFGGVCGVLLGAAIAWLSGYPVAGVSVLILLAGIAVGWFLLAPFRGVGAMSPPLPFIAAMALLVNLLAAGGIGFPAVADSLWLLFAVQLNIVYAEHAALRTLTPPKSIRWAVGLSCAALLLAVIRWEYIPVLNSRLRLTLADTSRAQGDTAAHRAALESALEADPWSTTAATRLAAQRFADYQALPTDSQIQSLLAADARVRELAPRSAAAWAQSAEFAGAIFRDTDGVEHRRAAEGCYARALALYPTSSQLQAGAARFWDSIGDSARARAAAAEALRIDDAMQSAGHTDRVLDTVTRLEIETLAQTPR